MHTLERLEICLEIARQMGYQVRREWLGGVAGGRCEFAGRRWIFVDLALSVNEQLDQVRLALLEDPSLHSTRWAPEHLVSLGLRAA